MSSFGRKRLMPLLLVVCGFLALPGTALGAVIWDEETGLPASLAEIPVEATLSWGTGWGGFEDCTVDGVLVVDESAEYATLPGGLTQDAACTQGTGQFTGCSIESTETPEGWTDFDSLGLGEGLAMEIELDPQCFNGALGSPLITSSNPFALERESEETSLDHIPLAQTSAWFSPSTWGGYGMSMTIFDGSLHATEGEWVIKD